MPRRKNSPWVTLLQFLAVCAIAWAGYEYVYVRGVFRTETKTFVPQEQLDDLRGAILEAYAKDACLLELGPVHYRAKQDRYRVDIVIEDGCEEHAKTMCREISELIEDTVGREAEVWALNTGHHTVTRHLP